MKKGIWPYNTSQGQLKAKEGFLKALGGGILQKASQSHCIMRRK